jgi:hypothetical protein
MGSGLEESLFSGFSLSLCTHNTTSIRYSQSLLIHRHNLIPMISYISRPDPKWCYRNSLKALAGVKFHAEERLRTEELMGSGLEESLFSGFSLSLCTHNTTSIRYSQSLLIHNLIPMISYISRPDPKWHVSRPDPKWHVTPSGMQVAQ